MLTSGYSTIHNVQAIIKEKLFSSTWLTVNEERTPYVILDANRHYWDAKRGPKLSRIIFRNDISPEQALQLCMNTDGHKLSPKIC
jgi:peptide/nickel transport system substrate-binding protein